MATSTNRHRTLASAVAGLILLAACDDGPDPTQPVEETEFQLAIFAGDSQVVPTGSLLPELLSVRVTDGQGEPVPDATIRWDARETGGQVTATSISDAAGIASAARILGPSAGPRETSARRIDQPGTAVLFTSIGQVQGATQMALNPGDHGSGQVDTVLATLTPYRVLVRDHNGAAVRGVRVSWKVESGGGVLSAVSSVSDASGVAEVTHTLGPMAGGPVLVVAAVPGLIGSPLTFGALANPGNPASLYRISSADAATLVNSSRSHTVGVADAHGNGAGGVTIDWAVTAGNGSIAPAQTVTATDPFDPRVARAAATHFFGPGEETHAVTATVRDAALPLQVTFTAGTVTARVSVQAPDYLYCIYYGTYCEGQYDPADITVPLGKTVGWNWDWAECDLVFEDDPTQPTSAPWQPHGSTHYRTFDTPGTYRFRCSAYSTDFADGMVGTVTVQEP